MLPRIEARPVPETAAATTTIQQLIEQLDAMRDVAENVTFRLGRMRERLDGPVPKDPEKKLDKIEIEPAEPPYLAALDYLANKIALELHLAQSIVNDLEKHI